MKAALRHLFTRWYQTPPGTWPGLPGCYPGILGVDESPAEQTLPTHLAVDIPCLQTDGFSHGAGWLPPPAPAAATVAAAA